MNAGAARIRRFSMVVWVFGTVVIGILAYAMFPQIQLNPQTGDVYIDEPGADPYGEIWAGYPWVEDDPEEYALVDGVLHGTRDGGFLRLPGGSDLVLLTPHDDIENADWVTVYQQLGTQMDIDADDWEPPGHLGSLSEYSDVLVMPGADDGLLWFRESLADWTATVSTPETIAMGESYEGAGNAVLLYEGDALSGRFRHTGTGLFIVSAVTVGDWELLVNEVDEVDTRISWQPSDRVAFFVESDTGEGSWSITLDTPAGDAPATPTAPVGEPQPTPTTDADR